jgi:hypothetical protein
MAQLSSIDSAAREKIRARLSPEHDLCVDSAGSNPQFRYSHGRPLPKSTYNRASKYIMTIMLKYPFQLRKTLAQALWDRFQEEWCDSGDENKSLRAI